MKNKFITLIIALTFNLCFFRPIFSNSLKIQRIASTGTENNCITQDKDGILWIGGWGKGLFCYNGRNLTKPNIGNLERLVPIIWSMFTDSEGLIWFVVADYGLCSYNKETGDYREYKSESENPVGLVSNRFNVCACNVLAEDKDGLIWIGTAEGLSSYDKTTGKFAQYKHSSDNVNTLSNDSIWALFVDSDGLVWIGTEDGLNCYDKVGKNFRCYKHDPNNPQSISDSYVRAIVEDKDGSLWIGTKNAGVDKFQKENGLFTNHKHDPKDPNSLSYDQIHDLMIDQNNNLWICNDSNVGLDIYNIKANTFTHYSHDPKNTNTISSNIRLCCFEDKSGIVWLIDTFGNINKCIWQKDIFKNYINNPSDKFSISSNVIAKIHEDKRGNIWIGTERGGLCLYGRDNTFSKFDHSSEPFSLPGVSVHSILDASDNKLWLGVKQGFICLFDVATKKVIKSYKNPYFSVTPCYLTEDNNRPNILWFACSYGEGIFKFDTTTGEFTVYRHDTKDNSSISSDNTFSILQDGDILWVGTGGNGLCKFDKNSGKCVYYKYDSNDTTTIGGNIVIDSFIDTKGNFWVTTDNGGLNKFDKQVGKFTRYGIECGFPSKCTRHILEDSNGYLWISTDSGIVKFDPIQLKVVRWFRTADGLPSNDFEDVGNAIKDSKANFWFSGLGLCKFNPEEADKIEANKNIPPIVLSSFKSKEGTYNENGVKKLNNIKLPWPDNSFEFTFTALDYIDPTKNQYAYKLEGFDRDWKHIGTNNFGQYSNLHPGEYILHLKGSNNDGIWNEDGLHIKITIRPPFWMTLWFKSIVGVIALLFVMGVYQMRIRMLKKKVST